MRRQFSNSAITSTGRLAFWKMKETVWSRVGPCRTLTLSGFRLTKRGIGKPETGPSWAWMALESGREPVMSLPGPLSAPAMTGATVGSARVVGLTPSVEEARVAFRCW